MNFSKLLQPILCSLILTFSAAIATSSAALAAKAPAEYPDAKRSEPKNDLKAPDQKKLSKAQELIGEDNAKAQEIGRAHV